MEFHDVDQLQDIATKHSLKVIYDAAHAFGVQCHCGSLLKHGDLSVLSFHATKVFNTFEGGAIISNTAEMKQKIDHLKNFGFRSETEVIAIGGNSKMNEFQAAVGLLQLETIDSCIDQRAAISSIYRKKIGRIKGLHCYKHHDNIRHNYSFFPILVGADYPMSRDDLYHKLKKEGIDTRRYFYPLITDFSMYQDLPSAQSNKLPHALHAANQVLCLPIYPELTAIDQERIIQLLRW